MKRAPINTTEQVKRDPLSFLASAMVLGSSNAIEMSEKQGQGDFVGSDTLPSECRNRSALEKAGVKFLHPVEGDELFTYVELPKGWKKVPTDHSMWSDLVDDKGHKRAGIFYKAAFYDRKAHMSPNRRFEIHFDYDRFSKQKEAVSHVMDCDKPVFSTEPIKVNSNRSWEYSDQTNASAKAWLSEHYPDHEDPAAYW